MIKFLDVKTYKFLFSIFVLFMVSFLMYNNSKIGATDYVDQKYDYNVTYVSNLYFQQEDQKIHIIGAIESYNFENEGNFYYINNSTNLNRFYFVFDDYYNYNTNFYILNLEYEKNAKSYNLQQYNQDLIGKNVIRLAVYINGEVYYAEQEYNIDTSIIDTAIYLNNDDGEIVDIISSNKRWYSELAYNNQSISLNNNISIFSTKSTPIIGDEMNDRDRGIVDKIGLNNFTSEHYYYGWVDGEETMWGYVINSQEWPSGSNNILSRCLLYEIQFSFYSPNTNNNNKIMPVKLQFGLVGNAQYLYNYSTNTIEPENGESDYRIYDLELGMECAQRSQGIGYDYLSERTVYNESSTQIDPGKITLSIVKNYDKSGILNAMDTISETFGDGKEITNYSNVSWPSIYEDHYESMQNKDYHSFVRGTVVKIDDNYLTDINQHVSLEIDIVD